MTNPVSAHPFISLPVQSGLFKFLTKLYSRILFHLKCLVVLGFSNIYLLNIIKIITNPCCIIVFRILFTWIFCNDIEQSVLHCVPTSSDSGHEPAQPCPTCGHEPAQPCTTCEGSQYQGTIDIDKRGPNYCYSGQGQDNHDWYKRDEFTIPGTCCTKGDVMEQGQAQVVCENCGCKSHLSCQPPGLKTVTNTGDTNQNVPFEAKMINHKDMPKDR